MYFSFDFGWYSNPFSYCLLRTVGVSFFLLNRQNLLSAKSVKFCQSYLSTIPTGMGKLASHNGPT